MLFRNPTWSSSDSIRLFSDASDLGYAVVLGGKWAFGEWPHLWKTYHINVREMFPITLSLQLWGNLLANHRIVFMTDNEAVAICINKQTSKDTLLMKLIRNLVVSAMTHNIVFSAKWILGKTNTVADLISRLNFSQVNQAAPWLQQEPTLIPTPSLPWIQP